MSLNWLIHVQRLSVHLTMTSILEVSSLGLRVWKEVCVCRCRYYVWEYNYNIIAKVHLISPETSNSYLAMLELLLTELLMSRDPLPVKR